MRSRRLPILRVLFVWLLTAATLLLQHGTLDGVLDAWGRRQEAEIALTFRQVARMREDVEVELPPSGPPDWESGAAAMRALGANNLADRLQGFAEKKS